jgi:FMN reductase
MSDVLTIAGSPSHPSRSSAILDLIRAKLSLHGVTTGSLRVRDFNAEDLLFANFSAPAIQDGIAHVAQARAVIIATPVYKAAYSGVLKAFLDLLPQNALSGKVVFPIATAGSSAHLLAIDYTIKPLLSALGAQNILGGLYVQDAQARHQDGDLQLDPEIESRLEVILRNLVSQLAQPDPMPAK